MQGKVSHFEIEWWVIQKRAVYVTALVLALCAIAAGASDLCLEVRQSTKERRHAARIAGRCALHVV